MSKHLFLKLLISFIVGTFFVAWVLNSVKIHELKTIFLEINFGIVFAGMLFYSTAMLLRVFRWHKLLKPFANLSFFQVCRTLIVGYAMNIILPARLGELFRVNLCKKWYHLSRSTALASVVWERVADGITVVACLIIGSFCLTALKEQSEILSLIVIGSAIFSTAVIALIFLRNFSLEKLSRRYPKIQDQVSYFQKGFQEVPTATLAHLTLSSLCIWFFEGLGLWAMVAAAGVTLSGLQPLLLVGVVSLSTLLPSPPGFLGTLQFGFGIVLAACGQSIAIGVVAATITQIFLLGSLAITGMIILASSTLKHTQGNI